MRSGTPLSDTEPYTVVRQRGASPTRLTLGLTPLLKYLLNLFQLNHSLAWRENSS